MKKKSNFSFIDLFAGIGGIRLPFQALGGKAVFSSEWDKNCQKTYLANFGEIPQGDITQIDPESIPNHDLILAGFPCQPFSHAGLKKGFMDDRGQLFFSIVNIIKAKYPHIVLLENVRGLKSHDKGKTLATICSILEDLGYSVKAELLNAKNFGVPQNRERLFIVALKKATFGDLDFVFPRPLSATTSLGSILENHVDPKYTISDRLWQGHLRRKKEHLEKGNGFGYSLFSKNSPYTSTLSARYYKDGSEILVEQEGKNPRKITPREAARLQGLPENFKIPDSDMQAYKQLGNSVAVPVIQALAERIDRLLTEAIKVESRVCKCASA